MSQPAPLGCRLWIVPTYRLEVQGRPATLTPLLGKIAELLLARRDQGLSWTVLGSVIASVRKEVPATAAAVDAQVRALAERLDQCGIKLRVEAVGDPAGPAYVFRGVEPAAGWRPPRESDLEKMILDLLERVAFLEGGAATPRVNPDDARDDARIAKEAAERALTALLEDDGAVIGEGLPRSPDDDATDIIEVNRNAFLDLRDALITFRDTVPERGGS